MKDILDDLIDLHKQATTERSHYYVASCCERAIGEIASLRVRVAQAEAAVGRAMIAGADAARAESRS